MVYSPMSGFLSLCYSNQKVVYQFLFPRICRINFCNNNNNNNKALFCTIFKLSIANSCGISIFRVISMYYIHIHIGTSLTSSLLNIWPRLSIL